MYTVVHLNVQRTRHLKEKVRQGRVWVMICSKICPDFTAQCLDSLRHALAFMQALMVRARPSYHR